MPETKLVSCANQCERYVEWTKRAREMHPEFAAARNDHIAWTPWTKALSEARVALVTSAGVHQRDQPAFDLAAPGGDPTYRTLDDSLPDDLMVSHAHIDTRPGNCDIDCLFPIHTLHNLVDEGIVGSTSGTHYGFMGFIPHAATVLPAAREVARRLLDDHVDLVLLTPG